MISKKRVLSVAAAVALSSSIVSAGYLPLTADSTGAILNAEAHDKWIMFGVAGFHVDGASAGGTGATEAGMFSITDDAANVAIDTTGADELYGTNVINKGATSVLGRVKRVDGAASSVEVRVDVSAIAYNETDPVRTIYVKVSEDAATPLFAFSYKSALEGQRLEFSTTVSTANDNAYFITINAENTYSNPAMGVLIPANDGTGGDDGTQLTTIGDVVDYDFLDNPVTSSNYLKADHQTLPTGVDNLRLYSYDPSGIWNIYDSRNSFNDFTELEKGKGYWGKMDLTDKITADTESVPAGLVLGNPTISTQNYIDSGIAEGWNLLAFNGVNPDLRVATTGLIITTEAADIELFDVSGNHSTGTITLAGADAIVNSLQINNALKQAKIDGLMPKTFNLVAIPTGAATVALISDEKFRLSSIVADIEDGATTLSGADPLSVTTLEDHNDADGAVMSKYGEKALVVKPENGGYAELEIDCIGTVASTVDIDAAIASTATNIATHGCIATAYPLDTDYDGIDNNDLILMVSPAPAAPATVGDSPVSVAFEVRDHTFTRVFQYTTDAVDAGILTPINADLATIVNIPATTNRNDAATAINAIHSGAIADNTNANNIIIRMKADGSNEFQIIETGAADNLTPTTSSSALAKGAISDVYSPNYFTKLVPTNEVEVALEGDTADVADTQNVVVTISTHSQSSIALAAYEVSTAAATTATVFYAELLEHLQTQLAANSINAEVTAAATATEHNGNITITGPDVTAIVSVVKSGTDFTAFIPSAQLGLLPTTNANGDITEDLKYNYIKTPDYVLDGPLYEMNAAGYKALAMVSGTMSLENGTVNWDGIDLTRKPSQWLMSQDYNLFTVDSKAGYWTFLEPAPANPLSFEATPFTGNYTQHFDTSGITYNQVGGGIEITVEGIDYTFDGKESARVVAIVGGSEVELSRDGDSNVYTGQISSHELKELIAGEEHDIMVVVADGLGNRIPATATGARVDFKKPTTPVLTFVDGTTMSLSNPEVDGVTKYYVYDGASATNGHIPATNTEAANLLTITPEAAAAYNICATPSFDRNTAYNLKIFALDGDNLSSSNASNVYTVEGYMPLFKNSALITNTKDVGDATTSIAEVKYTSACVQDETFTTDSSIQVSSLTNFATTKVAYEPKVVGDAVMITVHVDGGTENTRIGRITYHPDYVGETVFIQLGTRVYSYELPDDATAVASTEADPIDISDIANNGVYLEGQSLGE